MVKKEHTVRYSAEALLAMRRRGESKSDWSRAAAMTEGGNRGGDRRGSRGSRHDSRLGARVRRHAAAEGRPQQCAATMSDGGFPASTAPLAQDQRRLALSRQWFGRRGSFAARPPPAVLKGARCWPRAKGRRPQGLSSVAPIAPKSASCSTNVTPHIATSAKKSPAAPRASTRWSSARKRTRSETQPNLRLATGGESGGVAQLAARLSHGRVPAGASRGPSAGW